MGENNAKGYDVIAVLKDIQEETGTFKKKLIHLNMQNPDLAMVDSFDIITKDNLRDYDLVCILIYYKIPKLLNIKMDKTTGKMTGGLIGKGAKIQFPTLYAFDFPKGSLVRCELDTYR